jgi:hypothetical protein
MAVDLDNQRSYHRVLMAYGKDRVRLPLAVAAPADEGDAWPFAEDQWVAPGRSLVLRDGCLGRDPQHFTKGWSRVKATRAMVEGFIRLADPAVTDDTAVLRFARRWGVLELCQHGAPLSHEGLSLPASFAAPTFTHLPPEPCIQAGCEPVATWRYWARQARALSVVLRRLAEGQPGRTQDWLALAEPPPWDGSADQSIEALAAAQGAYLAEGHGTVDFERDTATAALSTWLRMSGTAIQLGWSVRGPRVGVGGGQLAGAIGLALMLDGAGATAWVICPRCGTQHAPATGKGRRPLYCEKCRSEGGPNKMAQARYRATPKYLDANAARSRKKRAMRAIQQGSRTLGAF